MGDTNANETLTERMSFRSVTSNESVRLEQRIAAETRNPSNDLCAMGWKWNPLKGRGRVDEGSVYSKSESVRKVMQ